MDEPRGQIHPDKGDAGHFGGKSDPEFPQLSKIRDHDRQLRIERAMEMGMSREEAERHAEHDLADREDGERTPPSEGPA